MAEPALKLVETEPVEEKAVTIVEQAKAVTVKDSETYTAAGALWKSIGDMIKEVKDTFDPICDAAHKAHKAAVEKRSKYLDPLTLAQKSIKKLMSDYDAEQDRKRREEQRIIEERLRKEEEERRLMEAIAAEEALKAQGATQEEVAQETATILEAPVTVAPVVLPKSTPKLEGGPVYRTVWKFRIKDANLIPRQYMIPDEKAIGAVIRSSQGRISIPGVEPYEERV